MIKDAAIAVLAGILLSRMLTQQEDLIRVAAMGMAVMVFIVLLWLEDEWDRHRRQITSRIRWYSIRLRSLPAEMAGRRRRRKRMQEYIKGLQGQHKEIGEDGG